MKTKLYDIQGKEKGEIDLDDKIFGLPWNEKLVSQVARVQLMNSYFPWADVKGRGEVSGGGKKPWKQKGTGRARQGSIRAPQWKGGGRVFGPLKEKDRSRQINLKMRRKAILTILSKKVKDDEMRLIDDFSIQPKTKFAESFLKNFLKPRNSKKFESALIGLDSKQTNLIKSFRNLSYARAIEARNFNAVDLLNAKYVFLTPNSIGDIKTAFVKK